MFFNMSHASIMTESDNGKESHVIEGKHKYNNDIVVLL